MERAGARPVGRGRYPRGADAVPGPKRERLRFILHLIGLIREDVGPSAIRQTPTLHFDGSVRTRRLVQTFVFVVGAVAREQAVPAPYLHGTGGDLQAVGHLVPSQQPAGP